MPTLSLAIQKGGSGKTTTAINLGAALRDLGHSVLLIDMDPQANLTHALGIREREEEEKESIYHLLHQELLGESPDLLRIRADVCGMHLIPASLELAKAELEMVSMYDREHALEQLLRPHRDTYDFILIDCPPAIGMLTINALVASDFVIMPLQAEVLPLKGVTSFDETTIKLVQRRLNKKLSLLGLILTQFDNRKNINQKVLGSLEAAYPGKVFDTKVRVNVAVVEAQDAGVDIFTYRTSANAAMDYMDLATELLERLKNIAEMK
ncbi:MAG: ParA family protein [Lewinellaceae bacterium]|nr:ParA family protein [Phaeodactylibacter sp.]MCB9351311.1 ParA family protein [Lewinellaceae bacterium]